MVLSALILASWFPAGALYHQRSTLVAANGELAQLHREDVALSKERKSLSDPAEVGRIARQQYQLVSPGQQVYEVLPPTATSPAGAPYAGDPGKSAPVPAGAELPSATVTTTTQPGTGTRAGRSQATARAGDASAPGVLQRMLQALEFWR